MPNCPANGKKPVAKNERDCDMVRSGLPLRLSAKTREALPEKLFQSEDTRPLDENHRKIPIVTNSDMSVTANQNVLVEGECACR